MGDEVGLIGMQLQCSLPLDPMSPLRALTCTYVFWMIFTHLCVLNDIHTSMCFEWYSHTYIFWTILTHLCVFNDIHTPMCFLMIFRNLPKVETGIENAVSCRLISSSYQNCFMSRCVFLRGSSMIKFKRVFNSWCLHHMYLKTRALLRQWKRAWNIKADTRH